jgi:DNA-binding LytR/AlgR family response regulator
LTTAFSKYALESYELNVVDYVLKPFSFQRFVQAISKVGTPIDVPTSITPNTAIFKAEEKQKDSQDEVYIKSGYEYIRLSTDNILYIMAESEYTELHLKEKKYLSSESLRYWEEFLPQNKFMRIHKSYVINTSKIVKVSGNKVYLENDKIVPIGRAYKNDFTERFIN